jgi:hypothetical protein
MNRLSVAVLSALLALAADARADHKRRVVLARGDVMQRIEDALAQLTEAGALLEKGGRREREKAMDKLEDVGRELELLKKEVKESPSLREVLDRLSADREITFVLTTPQPPPPQYPPPVVYTPAPPPPAYQPPPAPPPPATPPPPTVTVSPYPAQPAPRPLPAPAPAPAAPDAAMTDPAFTAFLKAVEGESFARGKLQIIERECKRSLFTIAQVHKVVENLSFSADRLKAMEFFAPRIVKWDRGNDHALQDLFPFSGDRSKMRAILDRAW